MSRLVYGVRPVQEVLRARAAQVQGLWTLEARQGSADPVAQIVELARTTGMRVQHASREELDQLSQTRSHQGVVAVVGEFSYCELYDLYEQYEMRENNSAVPPLLLVVDSVTDPQNLGAMFRAAAVLGATGVVLPKDRTAAVTSVVVRVSAGATEHLRCARVTNLARALRELKEHGIWVVGAVERGGKAPQELDLAGPVALVLGNEEKGLRRLVAEVCDLLVTIPTPGPFAALNVASATAVLMYEAARQRGAAPPLATP